MSMKYIQSETLGFIVFDPQNTHNDMRNRLGLSLEDILSAGEIDIRPGSDVRCHGNSVSLGKRSDPEDDWKVAHRLQREF